MNNRLLIKVKSNYLNLFINKLIRKQVSFNNLKYINSKEIQLIINKKDLKRIKSSDYKVKIIKYYGKDFISNFFLKNWQKIILFIFGFILLYVFSNIVLSVQVIHSNQNIRNLVAKELSNKGVKNYSFKKSFKNLEKIKKEILLNNPDTLEWLEIESVGSLYIVHVEERTLPEKREYNSKKCNVVAFKDGIIKKIIVTEGMSLKNNNNYVEKGDVIISGNIIKDEEVKNLVCAKGIVIGETWYKSTIKMPLLYEQKKYSNHQRYNLLVNNYKIFRSKYQLYDENKKHLFSFLGISFDFLIEKEYQLVEKKYSLSKAEIIALKRINNSFYNKLNKDEKIIKTKVLKKKINNSTIELEVFIVAEEEIGKQEEISEG